MINLKDINILITGVKGFLGSHIAKFAIRNGARVYGIGRGDLINKGKNEFSLENYVNGEINIENIRKACVRPAIIFHCASSSSVPFSIKYPKEDFNKSVTSTHAVLEFMRLHCSNSKLIFPSSAAVYGCVNKMPIRTNESLRPVSAYGNTKKMLETLIKFYSEFYQLKASIVRLFSVYGPGLRKQLLWDACNKIMENQKSFYGTGLETRDWIHVDDAVSLMYLAAENISEEVHTINGGNGKQVEIRKILTLLFEYMESSDKPEFSGIKRTGDPMHYVADISKPKSWGWEPQWYLEDGIKDYVHWFKQIKK